MTKHRNESRFQMNIGFIVFAIIFVYLTISIIVNLLKENVSVCRVEQGQIVSSASFTGICLRDEDVILASDDGYINFYVGEGDKVSEYGKIYLLNSNPPVESEVPNSQTSKALLDYSEMRDQITVFSKNYTDSQYGQIYSLKTSMHSLSTEMISDSEIKNHEIKSTDGKIVHSPSSGIVSYSYDGHENMTIADINNELFYHGINETVQVDPYTYIQKDQPICKLVNDHKWQIVIPLTDEHVQALSNTKNVDIIFTKDNIESDADLYIYEAADGSYGVLTLNDYMVRYISERYIDIEIIFNQVSGLKIPTSALLQKDFYKIPIQYLIEDNRSYESGFYCERVDEDGNVTADFRTTGIYYQDDSHFYVSTEDFELGDYIGKINSDKKDDRFQIGATGKLDGVYNVNKGYTQFEIVKILHKNKDYCIVQENFEYSVDLYDNIVLNSENVSEDQIVY